MQQIERDLVLMQRQRRTRRVVIAHYAWRQDVEESLVARNRLGVLAVARAQRDQRTEPVVGAELVDVHIAPAETRPVVGTELVAVALIGKCPVELCQRRTERRTLQRREQHREILPGLQRLQNAVEYSGW